MKASSPGRDRSFTVTAANTIVNTYTSLAANAAVGSKSINVSSAATLGVAPGDLILIIQMQGASINTSVNSSAWGAVTNYNNAGNYEFATVYGVSGNTILLPPCGPFLQHNYTASGRTQVIRVPQYSTLTINAGASIRAPAWNGSTGGVVAVSAQNTVTINGSIDVTGTGFRGGIRDNSTTGTVANVPGYAYTTAGGGAAAAAQKGESIAGYTADYDALGGAFPGGYGRGAPANGGGGGNAHNAGGGGGANGYNGVTWNGLGNPDNSGAGWNTAWNLDGTLTSSTTSSGGGRGGYTYGSTNANALAIPPGNSAWGGDYRQERGGLGGRPLINLPPGSNTSNRIFFGGGGGAGDGNNSASADGAPGGGIVFVLSPTVNGSGSIDANGQNGSNTISGHNDAPGGGGGGGSVVINATSLGDITINARGGKGGNQLITNNESEGPGGGGGGGIVATTGGAVPIFVNGGANGTTTSGAVTEFVPNGATAGAAGHTSTAVPSVPNRPCLGLSKTVTKVTLIPGPAYDVEIIVRAANLGSEQLANVQATDDLDAAFGSVPGTSFSVTVPPVVTFSPGSGSITGNNAFDGNADKNLLNPGTINIGSTALITFNIRVTPPPGLGPFDYNNSASGIGTGAVTGTFAADISQNGTNPDPDGDGDPGNNNTPTPIGLNPVFPEVVKAFVPNPVNPGTASTLTITLTNPSAVPLLSAALTDYLPNGLTTVSATAGTTCTGGAASQTATSLSLNGGTIPALGACTLSVQVTGAAGGAYVNTIPAGALTTSGGTNTTPATGTLTINDNSPVSISKSFNPASIPVGGVSQLTIVITNPNSVVVALNNPALTDSYPAGVINAATPAGTTTCPGSTVTATAGAGSVILRNGSVPANGSCTVTVNVTSATPGPAVTNTLAPGAVQTTIGSLTNTNTATAALTVSLLPPTVAKSFGAASIVLNGTTTLSFIVTNPNSSNLTGISFIDILPAGLTAPNGTTNNVCGGSGSMTITGGSNIVLTGITINGASGGASCSFNVTVTGTSLGTKLNTTGIIRSNQTGTGTTSNTAALAVTQAVIVANDDDFSGIPFNGFTGGTTGTVYTNDTLNGAAFLPAAVTPSITNAGGIGATINADGTLNVPAGTPAGSYTITYQICEVIDPSNCDRADVIVQVDPPVIDAVNDDFSGTPINGFTGGNAGNAFTNDTLNGAVIGPVAIIAAILIPASDLGVTMNVATGSVDVAAGTPAGTYTITYEICENLNPANCDTAMITVLVDPPVIDAVNDDFSGTPINGFTGGTTATVYNNDTLNGATFANGDVAASITNPGGIGVTINMDGTLDISPGTSAGIYTITYEICEILNPANCDTADVLVQVGAPVIVASDDSGGPVNGLTGAVNVLNVLDNDRLNGAPVALADVILTRLPGGSPELILNTDGSVDVPAGTLAGIYTFDYSICDVLNPDNCDTATVSIEVAPIPDLMMRKTVTSSGPYSVGDPISFEVVVTNTGNAMLTNVTVTDRNLTPGTVNCASVVPGGTCTLTGSYIVQQPDLNAGSFTNLASVTDDDVCPAAGAAACEEQVTVTFVRFPLLGIAKRAESTTLVSPGTWEVTYVMYIENYGNVTLDQVQVIDDLNTTFPGTTFMVRSISSSDFTVDSGYDGNLDTDLLTGADSLNPGESGTITLVVRVIPVNAGPYNNSATASGMDPGEGGVSDDSQDGSDPDPDDNGDPTNDNDPTPVSFGPNLFDPPFGIKTVDASGLPVLNWTMVWINDSNIVAVAAQVSDPIPAGTSYSGGLTCTASGVTTTTLCAYENPSSAYPRGRVVWTGNLGPDLGAKDAAGADNEVKISFSLTVNNGITTVQNIATIDSDRNGNGNVTDPAEQRVASASETWTAQRQSARVLPATGFAPNVVTNMDRFAHETYLSTRGIILEIPGIGVQIPIVGVPAKDGTWNVAWLGNQAGWLEGSAFPSWSGNSVLTGHVYLANGMPGPFVSLHKLKYGDRIIIHAYGQKYTFAVQTNAVVEPSDSSALRHEEKSWLTLVTCKEYDENTNTYRKRVVVRAVLIRVDWE